MSILEICLSFVLLLIGYCAKQVYNYISLRRRSQEVSAFLSNVIECSAGYLHYCTANKVEVTVHILPEGIQFQRLLQCMYMSSLDLSLPNWFDEAQIKAIELGKEETAQLLSEGKIQSIKELLN